LTARLDVVTSKLLPFNLPERRKVWVMGRLIGFVRMIRPVNCLMMGFAVLVGASLVGADAGSSMVASRLMLGFITAFTLTGASMAINDYYDREIDKINEPSHPIPSGLVTPSESIILAVLLTGVGLTTALLTNYSCLAVAVAAWVIMVLYNTRGKRTGLPGNTLVSACVAIPFIYGSLLAGGELKVTSIFFAGLAFLSNTGREVTKGIVDVPGDKAKNVRTVAVSYGERAAAYVAALFYMSAVLLSGVPVMLGLVSFWFIPPVIVADVGFAASSAWLIYEPTRRNAKRVKNLVLLWMMLGLVAFFLGG